MLTTAFVTGLLLKAKAAAISALAGFAMRWLLAKLKVGVPAVWAKIPEALRPYASTILGTVAGIVAGDPTTLVLGAAAGAAGGAAGKVVHDGEKKQANAVSMPMTYLGGTTEER